MDIIVDTREQKPLWTNHIRFKLLVGDYSTMKLREKFCIERKSLPDLYQTITKDHVRFRNELIRADVNGFKLVMYVEGTREDFIAKNFPGGLIRKTKSETLEKIMITVEKRYKLEVVWCKSRDLMKKKIYERLKQEENGKA